MDPNLITSLFSDVWSIILVVLFFGGSIFVHELGHYMAARKRGLVVERFSIGFGPRIFTWTHDGVEWCVSLFPLGGYVAIPQLSDMSEIEGDSKVDTDSLPPASFTDKIIVLTMGVIFNLIFAFILATILWRVGIPTAEDNHTTTVGFVTKTIQINSTSPEIPSPAALAGIQAGDQILAVDERPVKVFSDIKKSIVTGSERSHADKPLTTLTLKRDGKIIDVNIEPVLIQTNPLSGDYIRLIGILPAHSVVLRDNPSAESPAEKAGLKKLDEITHINGERIYSSTMLYDIIQNFADKEVELTVQREGKPFTTQITPINVDISKPLAILSNTPVEQLTKITADSHVALVSFVPTASYQSLESKTGNKTFSQFYVFSVIPENFNALQQIKPGDQLISANQLNVISLDTFNQAFKDPARTNHILSLERNKERFDIAIPAALHPSIIPPQQQVRIGIEQQLSRELTLAHINPFDQVKDSIRMTFVVLVSLINPKSDISIENLMGPPGILRTFHAFSTQDFRLLLWFTVLLNVNLAIINLLPIPVLDGGHILFAIIAKLRQRPISPRLIASTQAFFMLMLLGLMLYVSFYDIRRWQGESDLESQEKFAKSFYIQPKFK